MVMAQAAIEFQKLVDSLSTVEGVSAGQLFGKACLKIRGKAFVAQQGEYVVFKLAGDEHRESMALPDALLWDPSGKGRPMREWVALQIGHKKKFEELARAALSYVSTLA
jgi:hypothetical protein